MTIDEAIKILDNLVMTDDPDIHDAEVNALKLGIEALEWIKWHYDPPPRETEEK